MAGRAPDLSPDQRAALEEIIAGDPGPAAGENGAAPVDHSGAALAPSDALSAAKVDLIDLLRTGIPERAYVPGCEPWLVAGKRYLIPAPAGTGKSLAILVVAAEVIEAGGTVAILDVENGADEYARRLQDVLAAHGGLDGDLAKACRDRLRYFEWPSVSVGWDAHDWADAVKGADVVVFDSSRLMLSSAGLAEDSNDDYSTFVSALLVPLARAGIATIVLDNTGHEERDRARGASAKADLNEVVYALAVGEPFDRDKLGHLRLIRKRQRFAGLPAELQIPIGAGVYGPISEAEEKPDEFRPTKLMERLSEAVELSPGIGKRDLREAVKGRNDAKDVALRLLIDEGYITIEQHGQARLHHSQKLYRQLDDPKLQEGAS
jgi:hypothetical protein